MTKDEALKLALEALMYASYEDIEYDEACAAKVLAAKDAIKEALAQPDQEPVAYLCENAVGHKYFRWKKPSSTYKPIALYTTPPQRTWVGLTDEEAFQICVECGCLSENWLTLLDAIEAKLWSKNT